MNNLIKKEQPREMLLRIINECDMLIKDFDTVCDEGIHVILGFYSWDLIDRIRKGAVAKKDLLFLEQLILTKNDTIVNALEVSVFSPVVSELEDIEIIEKSFKSNSKVLTEFQKVMNQE